MAKSATKTYSAMQAELDEILRWFEGEAFDIDEALGQYEKALKLVKEMESYLKTAENKIEKIKLQFS